MIRAMLNWRSLLALIAIIIVSATIFYSRYLSRQIADDGCHQPSESDRDIASERNGLALHLQSSAYASDAPIRIEAPEETIVLAFGPAALLRSTRIVNLPKVQTT